jgi:hypothetical protein
MAYAQGEMDIWLYLLSNRPESKKSEVKRRGGKDSSHRLSSGSKSPKLSVVGDCRWGMMGIISEGELERRGWGYGGQHGSMVSGMQILTYQAYGHHSKSYIHDVFA